MTMLRLPIVALAGFLIVPANVSFAGITIATCGMMGCTCSVSPLDPDDIALATGYEMDARTPIDPSISTLVVDTHTGYVYWIDESRESLSRSYSGNGECPIELFPDEPIVPRDGLWQWNTLGTSVRGCPPMLAAMMADPAALGVSPSERVNWNGNFNPALFSHEADMAAYTWRDQGGDNWKTDPIAGSGCENGVCTSTSVQLWMSLVGANKARGHLVYKMSISGAGAEAMATLAGFGMDACNVTVRYEIDHIAD